MYQFFILGYVIKPYPYPSPEMGGELLRIVSALATLPFQGRG